MVLPVNNSIHLIPAYYSFIDPERMKGSVGLVGWPVADGLPTLVVTHQLQVEPRTGKVCQSETNVLPLCHATNRYQKGKTSLDLNEARDDGVFGRQLHQLDHMQTICTSLQTDNHISTSSLNFYRPDAVPDAQPAASEHWRLMSRLPSGKFAGCCCCSWS